MMLEASQGTTSFDWADQTNTAFPKGISSWATSVLQRTGQLMTMQAFSWSQRTRRSSCTLGFPQANAPWPCPSPSSGLLAPPKPVFLNKGITVLPQFARPHINPLPRLSGVSSLLSTYQTELLDDLGKNLTSDHLCLPCGRRSSWLKTSSSVMQGAGLMFGR